MDGILLVATGEGDVEHLAEPLRRAGHAVTVAAGGRHAADRLCEDRPEMIITGPGVFGRGGPPLMEALAHPAWLDVPVVLFCPREQHGADGGPRPFGRCLFVARGRDWAETYQRLRACAATANVRTESEPRMAHAVMAMHEREALGRVA